MRPASARRRATGSASAACSPTSISTVVLDLVVANGHIDDTVRNIRGNVGYAQPPQLFLNQGNGTFRDVAATGGRAASRSRGSAAGSPCGDFDRDGDVDLLMTTNNGPAVLFRNDQTAGNRSLRLRLVGTKSNRDAIGATVPHLPRRHVAVAHGEERVELSLAVGAAGDVRRRHSATASIAWSITWPSGRTEEFKDVATGKAYDCVEGKGISETR